MWGGRFAAGPEDAFDRLNRSLPVDQRLWREDVRGSQAWVQALKKAGILDAAQEATLRQGLDLWHLRVEDDSTENEEGSGNYTCDGNNGPKSVQFLFDGDDCVWTRQSDLPELGRTDLLTHRNHIVDRQAGDLRVTAARIGIRCDKLAE